MFASCCRWPGRSKCAMSVMACSVSSRSASGSTCDTRCAANVSATGCAASNSAGASAFAAAAQPAHSRRGAAAPRPLRCRRARSVLPPHRTAAGAPTLPNAAEECIAPFAWVLATRRPTRSANRARSSRVSNGAPDASVAPRAPAYLEHPLAAHVEGGHEVGGELPVRRLLRARRGEQVRVVEGGRRARRQGAPRRRRRAARGVRRDARQRAQRRHRDARRTRARAVRRSQAAIKSAPAPRSVRRPACGRRCQQYVASVGDGLRPVGSPLSRARSRPGTQHCCRTRCRRAAAAAAVTP